MGKKKVAILGTEDETKVRQKEAVKRQQKKLRVGEVVAPKTEAPITIEASVAEPVKAGRAKEVHKRSKTYGKLKTKVKVDTSYSLSDAVKLLREISITKFDSSVELHLNLVDKGLFKEVDLPHATGKARRFAVASDAVLAQIEKGKIDFDVLLASPDQMGKLVKFAKFLGPRGLMPNPKTGTVVANPEEVAKKMAGKNSLTLKSEKDAPLIHTLIGKLSLTDKQLIENIQAVLTALSPKVTKAILKSTMSPGIKLFLS